MLIRLVQAIRPGWKHHSTQSKNVAAGIGLSFLSGLFVLPFIPWVKGTFRRTPIMFVAGGLFHLGLLCVMLFSNTHMLAWKSVLGFGWPVLPKAIIPYLSATGIIAMLVLFINRLEDPVLRLISGPAEWLNWLFVFLPMATGFILARKFMPDYYMSFSIHLLLVDFLLVWIPFSRISHFMFYFFSRAIHGAEFNSRRLSAS
jgi:nitrate reductase gamma subunit